MNLVAVGAIAVLVVAEHAQKVRSKLVCYSCVPSDDHHVFVFSMCID
jgi:hypothetical protein